MNAVAKANAYLDEYMSHARQMTARAGRPVSCGAGCFWCCKEMIFAERREAVYLVESVPAEQRAELTAKTQTWWDAFFAAGFAAMPFPNEIVGPETLRQYRAAALWCPVLKDGLCTAYAHRPAACRLFTAVGPRDLCASDAERHTQTFMQTPQQDQVMLYALNLMTEAEALPRLQFDHLGIWLGHLLLNKTERSENAYEIETYE